MYSHYSKDKFFQQMENCCKLFYMGNKIGFSLVDLKFEILIYFLLFMSFIHVDTFT